MAALEPVIATLIANTAEFTASLDEAKAQMAEFGAAADTSGAEGDLANLGAAGTLAGEDVADGATVAAAGLNDAKTAAEDAKGGMTDLADGAGLAGAGLRDTHDAAEDAEGGMRDTESAAKDLGTAAEDSGGKFSGLSNILGSMGVPLGAAGSKAEQAGSSMDRAGNEAGIFSGKIAGIPIPVVAAGAALVGLSAVAVHMATSFQTSMTQLVTGAGESQKNIGLVSTGILNMAGQVGTSASDLASGMYLIESAGDHGAAGLQVLQAAAEGAKVGNANLADVANVVTSALNAYGLKAKDATSVTNQLVATVAAGKMHMQDLTTSIAAVLPVAASSKIAFSQIGGALATMTAQGMTARRASMGLANMIRALIAPSAQSSAEMKTLGLNANEVATNIGKAGLTGTLDQLTTSVLKSTQGGAVMATGFQNMSPAAKALSEQILAGTITTKNLTTAMQALSPTQAKLVSNFESSATSATGLKQTFDSAMKTMVGGATGLNVALLLTGTHAKTFADNVKSVADAAKQSGGAVEGFSKIQGDLAFQLDAAKDAVQAFLIKIGLQLIPVVTDLMSVVAQAIPILEDAFSIAFDIVKTAVVGVVTAITTVVKSVVDVITWFKAASIPALALGAALTTILLPAFIALGAQAVAAMVRMAVSAATTFGQMIAAGATWIAEQATQIAVSVANMGLFIARSAVMAAAWVADTLGMEGASAALTGALESLQPIAAQTATAIEETGAAAETAGTETSSSMETAAAAMETAATSMQAAATTIAEAFGTIDAAATTMAADVDASTTAADAAMDAMAADAEASAATTDAAMGSVDFAGIAGGAGEAEAAMGSGGLAGGMGAADVAGTGLAGTLGALALPLGAVALGMYALVSVLPNGNAQIGAFQAALDKAANIPTTGIDALNAKIGITQQVLDKARAAAASYAQQSGAALGDNGSAGGVRQGRPTAQGPDISSVTNEASAALTKYNALLDVANTNSAELGSITGLSSKSVDTLANSLGINLTKSLSPATIEQFTNYVKSNGGAAAVTGQQWQASAALMQAALEKTEAQAAVSMPGVSKSVQQMVSSTQPSLVSLVSNLNKTGDSAGGSFVSAFLAHLTPAQLASSQIHNAVTSQLLPLEQQLRSVGDTAAANQVAAFISHVPAAQKAAYSMHDALKLPVDPLATELATDGDTAGNNLVASFLNHNPDALKAASGMHDGMYAKLQPLEADLKAVGDVSAANIVQSMINKESAATQAATFMHDAIKSPLMPLEVELGTAGDSSANALIQDFAKHNPDAASSSKSLHDAISSPLNGLAAKLATDGDTAGAALVQSFIVGGAGANAAGAGLGSDFDSGLASGITQNNGIVINAAQGAVQAAYKAGRTGLIATSPSRLTRDGLGLPFVQGMAVGITDNTSIAASAADALSKDTSAAAAKSITNGMTNADWSALAQAGVEGGTAYLEALAGAIQGGTSTAVSTGTTAGVNVSGMTQAQINQVLASPPQPAPTPAVPVNSTVLSALNPGGALAGLLNGVGSISAVAPAAPAVNPGGPIATTSTVISQPINIQVNGQTLATTVATVLLKQGRSTGNILGQYAGGTQSAAATQINTNAVPR